MKASAGMPRRREWAQYQQVNAFDWGRMIGLLEAGLSYRRNIAARTGLDLSASTVCRRLLRAGLVARILLLRLHCRETTNASDCNEHVNAVTGVLSGEM